MEIPQNITVLELRQRVLQSNLFPHFTSLSGWRLSCNDQVLLDSEYVYMFGLPRGSILRILLIEGDDPITVPSLEYNSFNAATYNRNDYTGRSNQQFVRTIERSKHLPLKEEQIVNVPSHVDTTAPPVISEERKVYCDYFPILCRSGYYMRPDHFTMQKMSEEEVSQIHDFVVGREGAGEICWLGETDVRNMNLDVRVVIKRDLNDIPYIHVYPPELWLTVLPKEGVELNKRAEIRLFNMFPRGYRTDAAVMRYSQMLKRQVEAMSGEWIGYDISTGTLRFFVNHFFLVCWTAKVGFYSVMLLTPSNWMKKEIEERYSLDLQESWNSTCRLLIEFGGFYSHNYES